MIRTIKDINIKNKKVLMRLDLNVPIKDGVITDDSRIVASLDTIKYAIDNNAKVIIFSHLGRVKEESDKEKNDLVLVYERLKELLDTKVLFSSVTRGEELESLVKTLKRGEVLLVQNTRYEDLNDKAESGNNLELAKYWASLGDVFINDAFGTAHRAHASNVGLASLLESGVGFLIEKEFNELELLKDPYRPFVVILGGAKVSTKIGVLENLLEKVDKLLIGGAMMFTFLKAKNLEVGDSLVEDDFIDYCKDLLEKHSEKIVLPVDVVVSATYSGTTLNKVKDVTTIKEKEAGMDIGPKTIKEFSSILDTAKVVFWNGPLGKFEELEYSNGTKQLLEKLVRIDAKTILGGGDIVAAATKFNVKHKVTHASTGGGATLEYLEGKDLPGIKVIMDKK